MLFSFREAKIIKNVDFHEHPLSLNYDGIEWYCDKLTFGEECHRGHRRFLDNYQEKNYGCNVGCAFTFCDMCVYMGMKNEE